MKTIKYGFARMGLALLITLAAFAGHAAERDLAQVTPEDVGMSSAGLAAFTAGIHLRCEWSY